MAAQEKMKQGMSREDALRAVRLELGTVEIAREEVRSATWESFVENLWRDIRFALRYTAQISRFQRHRHSDA